MGYTVTHDFSAPAEVVFGSATDPARWDRWLPPGLRLEPSGPDELRVEWPGGIDLVRWQVVTDQLRAAVQPVDRPWAAVLTVVEGPAGGSTAQVRIDGVDGPARVMAEQSLARLGEEVSDNFNVS